MTSRRFSLAPLVFLGLWVLWFALPTTREAAQTQWRARFTATADSKPAPITGNSRDAQFVRATAITNASQRATALEALGREFPQDAAICAAFIVKQAHQLRLISHRQPGPSSSTDPNWSVHLAEVHPSPATLRSWFAATARGAKLEPNNTFWDWAQLIGLLAANRDSEVWPVLRAASQKTEFDDHAEEGTLAQLRLLRKAGPLSPIAQISIGSTVLFRHYPVMREAVRELSDDASGLRLAGGAANQKQALEGMRDVVLLSRVMRLRSKAYLGTLVGQGLESIAFWGGSYSATRPGFVRHPLLGSAAFATDPRSLLVFAQNIKRPEVAAQLAGEWRAAGAWRAKTAGAEATVALAGLEVNDFWWATVADWLGAQLLMALPVLLGWALVTSALLLVIPALRRESPAPLGRRTWVAGALLTLFATVMLSAALLAKVVGACRAPHLTGDYWLPLVVFQYSDSSRYPLSWQAYFPALLGALLALHLAGVWSKRRQEKPSLGTRLHRILHPPEDEMTRFDLSPLLSLSALLTATFVGTVGVLAYLIVPTQNPGYASAHDYAAWVLAALATLFALPALVNLRGASALAYALQLARRFAWSQLIFASLLWGLLWMCAAPAQGRFSAQFARQLQVGEFQIARKQLGI